MTAREALVVAHRLWSETPYPEGRRDEHKQMWRSLVDFLESLPGARRPPSPAASPVTRETFIVELQPGVWLSRGDGDPPRTLRQSYAARFESEAEAAAALRRAKCYRPFLLARVVSVEGEL